MNRDLTISEGRIPHLVMIKQNKRQPTAPSYERIALIASLADSCNSYATNNSLSNKYIHQLTNISKKLKIARVFIHSVADELLTTHTPHVYERLRFGPYRLQRPLIYEISAPHPTVIQATERKILWIKRRQFAVSPLIGSKSCASPQPPLIKRTNHSETHS